MSALLSLGEANHHILNADADIGHVIGPDEFVLDSDQIHQALTHARTELTEARAVLAAVRLAMRTQAMFDALEYHQEMAVRLREGAIRARMQPGRGLHASADRHAAYAAALRALIGTPETPFNGRVEIEEMPLPRRAADEKGDHAS